MRKEPTIGKIYFKFGIQPDWVRAIGYVFVFNLFKLIKLPPEGVVMVRGENYHGFMIEVRLRLPEFMFSNY